jgi:LmbE family N-acetylglucosaminyl deacetylase
VKILVVAAHPDDEILGVGGTIRKHADQGDEVSVLVACEGVTMRYEDEHRKRLAEQSRRASEILGIRELHFGNLPDQHLDTIPLVDVIAKVEEILESFKPEMVYTHFGGDVNHDHNLLFRAVQVATRPYASASVREVLVFETASSTEWGTPAIQGSFQPGVYVDISKTLEAKVEAFCCYENEVREPPHPRSPASLRARAQTWGSYVGVQAAEAFQVIRSLR